jgi:hypothetical protein
MNAVQRALLRAVLVGLVAIAYGPVGIAMATPPILTLESPTNGSVSHNRMPSFSGTSNDILDDVTLNIYAGTSVEPTALVQTLPMLLPPLVGAWSVGPAEPLADGVYTAQATQTNLLSETGVSEPPVTFTVDTVSPAVSLNPIASPTNDSTPTFSGSAGTASGDIASVTVKIYSGEGVSGSLVRTVKVTSSGATWTASPVEALAEDGTYTAQVEQADEAGNIGKSKPPVTFTVDTAPVVTSDPVDRTVLEGKDAVFTAAASGDPTPEVQWQVSTDGGLTWTNDISDPGSTTDTLTVASTTVAKSGDEYRAVFTNEVGTPLTIEAANGDK